MPPRGEFEAPPRAEFDDNARTLEAGAFDSVARTVESNGFDHVARTVESNAFDTASTLQAPVVVDNGRTDQMELFDPDELTNVDETN